MEVWDVGSARRFLEAAQGNPFADMFKLALYTGLRRSELAGLRWEGVDFETRTLRVMGTLQRVTGAGLVAGPTKTKTSRRAVALGQTAVDLLHSVRGKQLASQAELGALYQNEAGRVFTDGQGNAIDSNRSRREFRAWSWRRGCPRLRFTRCATFTLPCCWRKG